MLWELPHGWKELYDLERQVLSIDGCSLQAEYRYHVLGKFLPLTMRDRGLGDWFGVIPIMDADKCQKIVGARKHPEEARSRAEEELEALLERHYTEGTAERERCFFYELQEMERRANRVTTLEVKAVDVAEALCWDFSLLVLNNLAAARAKQDEAVNGVEAIREEATRHSAELVAAKSKVEALRARDVDSDVNEGQVAFLGSREVESFSEPEAARVEVAQLRAELEASQAKVARLQAVGETFSPRGLSILDLRSSQSMFSGTLIGDKKIMSALTTPKVDT
ncbi:hypothetical protein ACLOJK_022084 [Asimina triloba]